MAVSLSRCKKSRERRPWRRLGLRCCPVAAFMLLQLSARTSLQARRLRCAATALARAEDRFWQDLSLVAVFWAHPSAPPPCPFIFLTCPSSLSPLSSPPLRAPHLSA